MRPGLIVKLPLQTTMLWVESELTYLSASPIRSAAPSSYASEDDSRPAPTFEVLLDKFRLWAVNSPLLAVVSGIGPRNGALIRFPRSTRTNLLQHDIVALETACACDSPWWQHIHMYPYTSLLYHSSNMLNTPHARVWPVRVGRLRSCNCRHKDKYFELYGVINWLIE